MKIEHIVVVGGGISGLATAWLLAPRYRVTLVERNRYVGGHTHTVEVCDDGTSLPVDTGFIVYNEPNYPHLTALFRHLGIRTQPTDMSFAASVDQGRIEYAGSSLGTLFAQRSNLLRPRFAGMLTDILRFNRDAKRLLAGTDAERVSLGDWLCHHRYGEAFKRHYLLPMGAAIWSCPVDTMLTFPARSFARFFHNHGLLGLRGRPQWRTVSGGSWRYVHRMMARLGSGIVVGDGATSVRRSDRGVTVRLASGNEIRADAAVLGCHADEVLTLIDNPSPLEHALLSKFTYQENRAILHTDASLMPRRRRVWSSWNYLAEASETEASCAVSVTYWMNRLQRLDAARDYFVSLNPLRDPQADKIHAEMNYHHPVFDSDAMEAQRHLPALQGRDRIWFCGSYWGYGFHEDGLRSAVNAAASLGVTAPWVETHPPAAMPDVAGARPVLQPTGA